MSSVIFLYINAFHSFDSLDKLEFTYFYFQLKQTMQEEQNRNIEEATERVKERLPLEKIRCIPKYKNLSSEDYEKFIKNTETVALLILKAFILKNNQV
jgi:hypothetical protein